MKRILLNLLILTSLNSFAQESGINFEHDATWKQILEKAKQENKYILLDAYASWCGPCKWMSKQIFPKPEVGAAVNPHYISCKFDMEKGEGLDLAKKYTVRNYPTYLFFDQNGNLVHRSLGSMPANDFIKVINNALNPEQQYVTLKKKYLEGNKDSAFLRTFSIVAYEAQDSLYRTSMEEFLSTARNELTPANIQFVFNLTGSIHDPGFYVMKKNGMKFREVIGIETYNDAVEDLIWTEAKKLGNKGKDTVSFNKVIRQFMPEKLDMFSAQYEISLLFRNSKYEEYLPKAEAFAAKFCQFDYNRLADISSKMLENYTDTIIWQRALKIALRSIEIKSNMENNGIAAQLYNKLRDNQNAKKYALVSLELARKSGEETFEIEEFIKQLSN